MWFTTTIKIIKITLIQSATQNEIKFEDFIARAAYKLHGFVIIRMIHFRQGICNEE